MRSLDWPERPRCSKMGVKECMRRGENIEPPGPNYKIVKTIEPPGLFLLNIIFWPRRYNFSHCKCWPFRFNKMHIYLRIKLFHLKGTHFLFCGKNYSAHMGPLFFKHWPDRFNKMHVFHMQKIYDLKGAYFLSCGKNYSAHVGLLFFNKHWPQGAYFFPVHHGTNYSIRVGRFFFFKSIYWTGRFNFFLKGAYLALWVHILFVELKNILPLRFVSLQKNSFWPSIKFCKCSI